MALQLNVEIIQMQPPYHSRAPRASLFSGEFYSMADLVRSFEALRQILLDARTLLGWLLAKDARPVGVAGLSLGGALTLSLVCLEERFAFVVPLVAHMDLAALVSDAPVLTKMRHDLKAFDWRMEQFEVNTVTTGQQGPPAVACDASGRRGSGKWVKTNGAARDLEGPAPLACILRP
jgi:hypothetical protein